jgi:hypothetical protein
MSLSMWGSSATCNLFMCGVHVRGVSDADDSRLGIRSRTVLREQITRLTGSGKAGVVVGYGRVAICKQGDYTVLARSSPMD